jgi:hypothetical protein
MSRIAGTVLIICTFTVENRQSQSIVEGRQWTQGRAPTTTSLFRHWSKNWSNPPFFNLWRFSDLRLNPINTGYFGWRPDKTTLHRWSLMRSRVYDAIRRDEQGLGQLETGFGLPKVVERSLFRAVFFEPKPLFNQQLNSSRWPLYCDHSVTSADVRLSVGRTIKRERL